jgi:hypothetical protein
MPSTHLLVDFERELFTWLEGGEYDKPGWRRDISVRDTGPFANQVYYGVHPAVRIWYSPKVMAWLESGREGEIEDGAVIVKEMFTPPAAIYDELRTQPFFAANPDKLERLLAQLRTGWAVMIKDTRGESVDGWFYAGMSKSNFQSTCNEGVYDGTWSFDDPDGTDYLHPYYSNFGVGTCVRCHASAERENTFISMRNIEGPALEFRHDDSWRAPTYLDGLDKEGEAKAKVPVYTIIKSFLACENPGDPAGNQAFLDRLDLPIQQRTWGPEEPSFDVQPPTPGEHQRRAPTVAHAEGSTPTPSEAFIEMFTNPTEGPSYDPLNPLAYDELWRFPQQWSDHVFPGRGGPGSDISSSREYITSTNCLGCHGGLGGTPPSGTGYPNSMFIKTGPNYGDGFDISPYGEWRWSPMGLAGRDPIFHSQLETELIILNKNADDGELHGTLDDTKKALIDTCLSCHGAMGKRQLEIDKEQQRKLSNDSELVGDFNPDYFYLTETLEENASKPFYRHDQHDLNPAYEYTADDDFYLYHEYGELAREGISCAVCHRITGPGSTPDGKAKLDAFVRDHGASDWFPEEPNIWPNDFIYFLGENSTGQYERTAGDVLVGPFEDITQVPMQNALGITPKHDSFISDSRMCGTCHTINLPNIGDTSGEHEVLQALENNPAFTAYGHSIEQATYVEWLNSEFGPGVDNLGPDKNPKFQSCQDCHMPNRFESPSGELIIEPLISQIASIQDTSYPKVENALPSADITVPLRHDYRRHELVGLNVFLVEMARQFPGVLGLSTYKPETIVNYETSATTGPELAIANMANSARNGEVVTIELSQPSVSDGKLQTTVSISNQTGHRFPSGVSFRRAFIEFAVLDTNGEVLWISGQTNGYGVILGANEEILNTEFLNHRSGNNPSADYQPHHQVISSQDQVQIYEELITDADHEFTTSFIHRVHHVKDNRLLPRGWVPAAQFAMVENGTPKQGELLLEFMAATDPEGKSVLGSRDANDVDPNGRTFERDCDYAISADCPNTRIGTDALRYEIPLGDIDGRAAKVRVRVYSQALMPAWIYQRFELAAQARAAGKSTPETDRLMYLLSALELEDTVVEDWKLELASVTAEVSAR